jgi:hypothetical protein
MNNTVNSQTALRQSGLNNTYGNNANAYTISVTNDPNKRTAAFSNQDNLYQTLPATKNTTTY